MSTTQVVDLSSSTSKVTWKIGVSDLKSLSQIYYYSDVFSVGNFQWKLCLTSTKSGVSLDLAPVDLRESVFVRYSFAIRDVVRKGTYEFPVNGNISMRGWQMFTHISRLLDPAKGYVVNNICVITVELTCRTDNLFDDEVNNLARSNPNKVPVSEAYKKAKLKHGDSLTRRQNLNTVLGDSIRAGKPFGEGTQNCKVGFGDPNEFEDVGGFSISKAQVPLYRQIWLKYGHIPTTKVMPISSYHILVLAVKDLMTSIIAMHQCSYLDLSSRMIEGWEQMLVMAEKFEFNVGWLRERFESVKKGVQKVKVELLVHGRNIRAAKSKVKAAEDELKKAEAQLTAAKQRLRENASGSLSESDMEMYLIGDNLLLDGLF